MEELFFISYSRAEAGDFVMKLADELASGPPAIPVFLDRRELRPGEQWDEQLVEAIKTCKAMLFVMSPDSVHPESVCKNEWVRALRYKKPVIPLLLHPDAELPFSLGSREYIDFTDTFQGALARLRKHVVWLDTPAGLLQALKHRLSDAQREVVRAAPARQARIQEEIAELQRQIAQQQRVIENPAAAEQRVQQSIDAALEGERKPARPMGGTSPGKFINPPPLVAPTWFQDRHFETAQIGAFLKDDSLRLLTVVGRGGMGKSALVCRLLRALEGGQLPDDGGPLTVDGIVYLSHARSFHRVNVPDLYASLAGLLSEDALKYVEAVYKNPQSTAGATMQALAQAFARGRTVILLDNFEDTLDLESAQIKDADLNEALGAILTLPPHGLKIIITTRLAARELAMVEPGRQRRIDLDTGLEPPYAENILRAMDADGKVGLRDAPDELLAKARERTRGFPRALEHLFGILSADRDTSLQEILENTSGVLPEQVVTVLVGEAFSRLDPLAQRVMQALAVYRYPVAPAAVDYLLQQYVQGVDSARVLNRLVNMQFAGRDAGRYYLHQVDREYALSRLAPGQRADREAETPPLTVYALRHRAAEWFRLARKPRKAWTNLDDLAVQLAEFDLRCEAEDYDTAAALLEEFDFDLLLLWGHFRLMIELHQRLQGRIVDVSLACNSVGNLGSAYFRMGQLQQARDCYMKAYELARDNRLSSEMAWLTNQAMAVIDLGDNATGRRLLEELLPKRRVAGQKRGESRVLANLAAAYAEIGQITAAIAHLDNALLLDREMSNRENEAMDYCSIGEGYRYLGDFSEGLKYCELSLKISKEINHRFCYSAAHATVGAIHIMEGQWKDASRALEEAIEISDEIGSPELQKEAREQVALMSLFQNDLIRAREMAETARKYDSPRINHGTSTLLGVIALRQNDPAGAQESFTTAVIQAQELIAMTPERYGALDTLGLSYCGLSLCGDAERIADAKAAYKSARTIAPHKGIVRSVLQLFDALAQADKDGIMAEVRPFAAASISP
jgi:tetratricopeptide (TPR) repeat protein